MKSKELTIAYFFNAYDIKDIIKGFHLWNEGIVEGLEKQFWRPAKGEGKPAGEYFLIDGVYYVQDEEAKLKDLNDFDKNKKDLPAKVKPIPPFKKRVTQFLLAKFGPRVIQSVFKERRYSCGVGKPEDQQCEYLKIVENVLDDKYYCGACGCGERADAELNIKLKMSRVECPKIPPVFKAIDEKTERHLLI